MSRKCLRILAAALLAVPTFAIADISSGLVAYYSFDDGTAADDSGHGRTGTLVGSPVRTGGIFGDALQFNVGSYVALPDLNIEGTSPRTVMAWFKTAVPQTGQDFWATLVSLGADSGPTGTSFLLMVNDVDSPADAFWDWQNGGYLGVHYWMLNTTGIACTPAHNCGQKKLTDLDNTRWHHLATTFNSTAQIVYLDGQVLGRTNWTSLNTAPGPAYIAYRPHGPFWYRGAIDEVRCYDRVLSEVEILEAMSFGNPLPIASAGPDQTVDEGALAMLAGSGSDPLDRPLTYAWTQLAGPTVELSDPAAASPTFAAPVVPAGGATLTLQLVVTSEGGPSEPDAVDVTIHNVNHRPIAEATVDQPVPEESAVTLDGRPSYDLDDETLTYAWTQSSGPEVSLEGALTPVATFTAPAVGAGGATLAFRLVVNDGIEDSLPAAVTVAVTNVNQPPTAHAGEDFTADENALVALPGTGTDPDLDPLTFSWAQAGGDPVVLSDPSVPSPTFWAPFVNPGGETFTFRLVVNDGSLDSEPDDIVVHVLNSNDPPSCAVAAAEPASIWPPNHKMIPVGIRGVVDPQGDAITIVVTGVMQDEPIFGLGDGDTSPDAALQGDEVLIRAERAGTGDGRVYTVSFTATDDFGESCSGSVKVAVPSSMKKGAVPVDGGPLYLSTAP